MKYYLNAFRKYATMAGRAPRREYIWFVVINTIVSNVLVFLVSELGDFGALLYLGYLLAAICPGICVSVRRFHDVGKSGAWWWASFVPILNLYVIYLQYFKKGDEGVNDYGAPDGYQPHSVVDAAPQPVYQQPYVQQNASYQPQPGAANVVKPMSYDTTSSQFCRKCGAKVKPGSKFCESCGTRILELPM